MKVIEILNFNRELLKRLQAAGIRLEDARYIDLYADYTRPVSYTHLDVYKRQTVPRIPLAATGT